MRSGSEFLVADLTSSLTKKEAVSVRRYLERENSKEAELCLELYDAIRYKRSQEADKLVERLHSEELRKYLSFYKGKLREHILHVLAEKLKDVELLNLRKAVDEMAKCWVLHSKGFRDHAIDRVERFADRPWLNRHHYLRLMLLEEQHRILRASGASAFADRLETNWCNKAGLLNIIENKEAFNRLEEEVFHLYIKFRETNDTELMKRLDTVFNDQLLQKEDQALCFQTKLSYHSAHMLRSRLSGNKDLMIKHMERIVELWECDDSRIKERPYVYQRALINLLNGYYTSHHMSRFELTYEKAKSIKLKSDRDRAASIVSLLSVKLAFLLEQREMKKVALMQKETEEILVRYEKKAVPSTAVNLKFNLGVSYFLLDDHKRAKHYFQELAYSKLKYRMDLKGAARILLMLSEFDRDNMDYISSLKNEAQRFYRQNRELKGLDGIVFGMVSRMISQAPSNKVSILAKTRSMIEELKSNNKGGIAIEEVLLWVESHLQGRPIGDVIQVGSQS